jgi:uncharacterized protein (DUF2252 family)
MGDISIALHPYPMTWSSQKKPTRGLMDVSRFTHTTKKQCKRRQLEARACRASAIVTAAALRITIQVHGELQHRHGRTCLIDASGYRLIGCGALGQRRYD